VQACWQPASCKISWAVWFFPCRGGWGIGQSAVSSSCSSWAEICNRKKA
jgi:hypothetical protein